ncbi:FtsX-like permease family protein [Dactylosporangium sp. NPDC048998]|uniref:ABC transporter permease n=1 Tax=Dactylosporangium sp. NPDC048998 TaxID=3363976 RepID=UPI00371C9BFC
MSAVWRAARAAVRRRRLQTGVIGVVVALSTVMIVVALGLLAESSGPFDRAYDRQSGAHLVAAFDRAKAPDAQLTDLARRAGVSAAAGPFGQVALDVTLDPGRPPLSLTVVGRDDPGGPVDRLNVWQGRWPTKLGEIVLNENPANFGPTRVGTALAVSGGRSLTVVGFAYSVSESAGAWVTPEQMSDLHPTTTQMLYRFAHAATDAQMTSATTAVTAGLPPETLLGSRSYLALRTKAAAATNTFVPFLMVFGCLALAVAVLIVANVVSGAVVAGFRHIGVLKALGFTPAQVLTVYLTMVLVPALTGCVLGTVLGNLAARSLLTSAFKNYGSGGIGVAGWVDAATLVGVPAVVALSALLPALRARSLSATEAISAGSAPHSGRGLRIQRWLAGTRLPRAASLGLGIPFARPARSALTMAAVVLGVASVTFAIGLASTVTTYQTAQGRSAWVQVQVFAGPNPGTPRAPKLTDTEVESMLRSLPGAAHVTAAADVMVRPVGSTETFLARFYRGDTTSLGYEMVDGHWPAGPGEVVVSERFLRQRGFAVGETFTVDADGRQQTVRIVGKVLMNSANMMLSNWETLALVAPGTRADSYEVGLEHGADTTAFLTAVKAGDPGLNAVPANDADSFIAVMFVIVTVLTLMLGTVAALGVFNTVVLNTRERHRDLGMLKSIGMTPRQVVLMMVTSMSALGAAGGLLGIPLGVVIHRLALPAMAHAAQLVFPDRMLHVYHLPVLALLALAGIGIAAFGAFLPARSAARLTIAEALHNE